MAAVPAARPPRRVVLTVIERRDAAHRLGLALGLLAREARADQEGAAPAPRPPRSVSPPVPPQEDVP